MGRPNIGGMEPKRKLKDEGGVPYFFTDRFQVWDQAFLHLRRQTRWVMGFSLLVSMAALWQGYRLIREQGEWVYVLGPEGQAAAAWRWPEPQHEMVEAEDQLERFHQMFFDLEPDAARIDAQVQRALQWGDESVGREYRNLMEQDYYRTLIRLRIRQRLRQDSLRLENDEQGLSFRFYGRLEIIRLSGTRYRSLVTLGQLIKTGRSRQNPHGLMIRDWRIIENEDMIKGGRDGGD